VIGVQQQGGVLTNYGEIRTSASHNPETGQFSVRGYVEHLEWTGQPATQPPARRKGTTQQRAESRAPQSRHLPAARPMPVKRPDVQPDRTQRKVRRVVGFAMLNGPAEVVDAAPASASEYQDHLLRLAVDLTNHIWRPWARGYNNDKHFRGAYVEQWAPKVDALIRHLAADRLLAQHRSHYTSFPATATDVSEKIERLRDLADELLV
jgi:hypothetical protein